MGLEARPQEKQPLELDITDGSRSIVHFLCEESRPGDRKRTTGWQWQTEQDTWEWFDAVTTEELTSGYCRGLTQMFCHDAQTYVNFRDGVWNDVSKNTHGILRLRIHKI